MKKLKKLLSLNAADPRAKRGCRRNPIRQGVKLGVYYGRSQAKKTYLKGWVV